MKMPIQRLARSHDRKFLVMASNALLQVIDLKTGQILSSSSTSDPGSHSGLIRLLAIHQDSKEEEEEAGQNQKSILISTGEDKLLKTWELPSLKLLQSRELAKRATALSVSPNGKNIVIGDKSGDIYNIPFDAPHHIVFASDPDQEVEVNPEASPAGLNKTITSTDEKPTILAPIAGHVSILTAMTFIPSEPTPSLVTADRDEHVRISRYPKAWSIERYLLGHQRFVGSLLWLGSKDHQSGGVLLSGGGEDEVFVWDTIKGSCLKKVSVKLLGSGLKVQPEKEAWFIKSRNNLKRQKHRDESLEPENLQANASPVPDLISEPAQRASVSGSSTRVHPTHEICIHKMIYTSSIDSQNPNYVVVTSVGSSILAILPVSSILESGSSDQVRYHDFKLPILDLVDLSGHELLVSLDPNHLRGGSVPPPASLRGLVIGKDEILETQAIFPGLDHLNTTSSSEESPTDPIPSSNILYPELILFQKGTPLDHRQPTPAKRGDSSLPPPKKQKQASVKNDGGKKGKKVQGRLLSHQRVGELLQTHDGPSSLNAT